MAHSGANRPGTGGLHIRQCRANPRGTELSEEEAHDGILCARPESVNKEYPKDGP
jgi:hypothetical protein